ncbi:hypothetical protein EXIGLDRAFT_697642 [Exidia glandulosa HHB12029]|uniref:DUF6532 domain-containing protein n=1 Tax=Exidia glandulosa HHB12029 TaxID=1314781 RepID=A0A165EN63_EXIGL|nr:hypothetical protein EXIGLDRAFT_697642 [Exidia glandulosa HHB12029]
MARAAKKPKQSTSKKTQSSSAKKGRNFLFTKGAALSKKEQAIIQAVMQQMRRGAPSSEEDDSGEGTGEDDDSAMQQDDSDGSRSSPDIDNEQSPSGYNWKDYGLLLATPSSTLHWPLVVVGSAEREFHVATAASTRATATANANTTRSKPHARTGPDALRAANSCASASASARVRPNPKRRNETLASSYTSTTGDIIRDFLQPRFRAYVATKSCFPTLDEVKAWIKPHLTEALQSGDAGKKNRVARMGDADYVNAIAQSLHSSGSGFRNHVYTVAKRVALEEYIQPLGRVKPRERCKKVNELLRKHLFVYADAANKLFKFEHNAIYKVIEQSMFTAPSKVYSIGRIGELQATMNPFPVNLIAFAAVMMAVPVALSWTPVTPSSVIEEWPASVMTNFQGWICRNVGKPKAPAAPNCDRKVLPERCWKA